MLLEKKLIGIINNETTPKFSTGKICFTTRESDSHRGGGIVVVLSGDNKKHNEEQK